MGRVAVADLNVPQKYVHDHGLTMEGLGKILNRSGSYCKTRLKGYGKWNEFEKEKLMEYFGVDKEEFERIFIKEIAPVSAEEQLAIYVKNEDEIKKQLMLETSKRIFVRHLGYAYEEVGHVRGIRYFVKNGQEYVVIAYHSGKKQFINVNANSLSAIGKCVADLIATGYCEGYLGAKNESEGSAKRDINIHW